MIGLIVKFIIYKIYIHFHFFFAENALGCKVVLIKFISPFNLGGLS